MNSLQNEEDAQNSVANAKTLINRNIKCKLKKYIANVAKIHRKTIW